MAGALWDQPNREVLGLEPIWVGAPDDGPEATGATAGIPGSWTPAGAGPPASIADLIAGRPNVIIASPATPWTTGQYVQTMTAGAAGRATWTGSAWVGGAAPLGFDPSAHNVDEVKAYVEANPGERASIAAAEAAGKNRTSLADWFAA